MIMNAKMTRSIVLIQSRNLYSKIFGTSENQSRNKTVLNEAEAVVGYPTSFLNLKFLLSDEVAGIGLHLRKLMGTKHPLLSTIKDLFMQNELPSWGLIVLLVAKAAGENANFCSAKQDTSAGILYSQRALAEITEMIRKSIQIHKGILNFPQSTIGSDLLNYGNKMALLSGDYLLSKSYRELANICNQDVTEIISMGLRDLVASEFVGPRDKQNHPLPAKPIRTTSVVKNIAFNEYENELKASEVLGYWKGEWVLRNSLSGGNLLGRACQGCFILAGHQEELSKEAFVFGKSLALALQCGLEIKMFLEAKLDKNLVVCLPALYYLHENPKAYAMIEAGFEDIKNINFKELHEEIMKTSGVDETKEVQRQLCDVAQKKLEIFPEISGRNVLDKIIKSLRVDL